MYLRHIAGYHRGLCAANAASGAASCSDVKRLPTLGQPSLSQEFGTLFVQPEKRSLLELAGSQSRAEVANDQHQRGSIDLFSRGKKRNLKKAYLCVIRLSLGRRLVNLFPVSQRTNAFTNGVVDRPFLGRRLGNLLPVAQRTNAFTNVVVDRGPSSIDDAICEGISPLG